MSKVWQIAVREFAATVFTKGFIIGLLIFPTIVALGVAFGPRLFGDRDFSVAGQIAIIDSTGKVLPELRSVVTTGRSDTAVAELVERARAGGAADAVISVLQSTTKLALAERPADADIEREKAWLNAGAPGDARLALVVLHRNAVEPAAGETALGSYDLYVPANTDNRVEIAVQGALREAIINARMRARDLDRAATAALVTVPRVRSVTVTAEGERGTVGGLNFILPVAFMFLLFMGVMGAGQGMLTTTVEEKSSRVIEVLLSAVSPLELMGGKLLGHMGISLLAMSLYLGLGLITLASFSLFGLLDLSLIGYLFIFFLIAFFTIGSLMMAVGAAVNDMREAQQLMMPMSLLLMVPWMLWFPISRNPDSVLATVVSFLPPLNTFGMLMRLASTSPPPAWQVWLSIAIGIAGVFGTVWITAKVFRIGLLMFGKPPDFKTLVKWVRAA
jgi:ABC-2 type transport system permease protein